jgi:hypothetical protein
MTYVLASYLFVFANLNPIVCPKYLPGTDVPLPAGVMLSPEQELQNRVRCYCETVKREEALCIRANNPRERCVARTKSWIRNNLQILKRSPVVAPPQRNLIINMSGAP